LQIAIFLGVDVKDIITYPNTEYNNSDDEVKAVLQIELKKDKKEQVMKLIFGDNNLEIFNKYETEYINNTFRGSIHHCHTYILYYKN